jgi:3-oxoacyl-[acyl-carrier protein] reductase
MNDLDFSGKTALVTGAARGIGKGIAEALRQRGAMVLVNDLKEGELPADIGDAAAVAGMARSIQEKHGGLDLLVNNAGLLRDRSMKKMSQQDWDDVIRVNLTGTFNMLQAFGPLMNENGRIVNMASVAGTLGFFGQANYAASKAGIIALTKVASKELARQKVTVNAVAPGFVHTEMTAGMPQEVVESFNKQIPLGRWAQVEDIVGGVLFLCSDLSRYVTGQVLHINGGFFTGSA